MVVSTNILGWRAALFYIPWTKIILGKDLTVLFIDKRCAVDGVGRVTMCTIFKRHRQGVKLFESNIAVPLNWSWCVMSLVKEMGHHCHMGMMGKCNLLLLQCLPWYKKYEQCYAWTEEDAPFLVSRYSTNSCIEGSLRWQIITNYYYVNFNTK